MARQDRHLAQRNFEQFVETVAENNREQDGSSPKYVAEHTIVSNIRIEDPKTGNAQVMVTFNAEPYYDKRAWPKDVLIGAKDIDHPYDNNVNPSFREIAVAVLSSRIAEYYDEHGWEQGNYKIEDHR